MESERQREGSLETSSDYKGEAIEDKGGFSASRIQHLKTSWQMHGYQS